MPITLKGPYNLRGVTDSLNLQAETLRFRVAEEGTGIHCLLLTPRWDPSQQVCPGWPTWVSGSCWAYRQSPGVGRSPWGQSCQSLW